MSYRRNTASQTVYAVMVNATTGAAETSGVAVTVSKDGAAGASGSGTLAHIAEGLWAYTFAAGELDATATGFVFSKSGAVPSGGTIRTTQANPDDAVRLGLTALPNAAANANGGLPILSSSGTTLAYTVSTLTTYTGNTPQTGDAYARIGAAGAGLTALGDTRLANLDAAISTRSTYGGGDTSGTTTLLGRLSSGRATNLDNLDAATSTRATAAELDARTLPAADYATAAALATVDDFLDTEIAVIKAKTDNLPADPADASDVAAAFSTVNSALTTLAGYVDTEVAAIKAKTDLIPAGGPLAASSYTAPPTTSAILAAILAGTPTPRDVSAVTAPTVADCLMAAFCGAAGDSAVSGTTYLVKQPDGAATFRAFTLDSGTAPTSRT